MKKQKHMLSLGGFLLICLLVTVCGCTPNENYGREKKTGIQIESMVTGLGTVDGTSLEKQKLTYSVTLTNYDSKAIYVRRIEPVLGNRIKDKVITENLAITVDKQIAAGQNLNISGNFIMNTKGLSKEQILGLEPYITDIRVNSDQTIQLHTQ